MTGQAAAIKYGLNLHGTGADAAAYCPPKVNSSNGLVGAVAFSLLFIQTGAAYAKDVSLTERTMAVPDDIPPWIGTASRASIDSEIAKSHHGTAVASVVLKIKEASGLTWAELSDMLGVERRTLHFWASGRPINAPNENRLRRTFAVLTSLRHPSQGTVRDLLWEPIDGGTLLDLLHNQKFDDAEKLVRSLNVKGGEAASEQPTFMSSLLVESDYVPPEPDRAQSVRRRRR